MLRNDPGTIKNVTRTFLKGIGVPGPNNFAIVCTFYVFIIGINHKGFHVVKVPLFRLLGIKAYNHIVKIRLYHMLDILK